MAKVLGSALVVLALGLATEASARSRQARVTKTPDIANESYVTQAPQGRNAPARPLPADQASNPQVRGPSAPVTCNEGNASSPACYTATQQARPVAR